MSEPIKDLVLIAGASSSGKSASLMNLEDHPGVMYLNCESGKRLPFPNKFDKYVITDPLQVYEAFDAAACIGCGACVATCKNSSAMLFVAARVSSLALLPQGKIEGARRAKAMVARMDELGFGACTNTRACEMECPKGISVAHIARLNREFLKAKIKD